MIGIFGEVMTELQPHNDDLFRRAYGYHELPELPILTISCFAHIDTQTLVVKQSIARHAIGLE